MRRIASCLLLAATASADTLCLQDGRIFDDVELERGHGGYTVRYENGDVFVPEQLVLAAVANDDAEFVPVTEEEKAKFEEGLAPFEGEWIPIARRKSELRRLLKEQRELVAEALAHSEWTNRRIEDTRHFTFHYTIPQHVFEGYRDRMEAYFKIFAREWKVKQDRKKGKLNVSIYADRAEFNRTSGAKGGTLAYFMFLENYDLNLYYDRLDPDRTETIMYHEANHYLQKLVNDRFSYPHWPGEALAEYYGGSAWDEESESLTVGLMQESRAAEIHNDISKGKWIGLAEMVSKRQYEDYTWGWSLVHYLMNDKHYAPLFKRFFVGLAKGRDVERVDTGNALRTCTGEAVLAAFKKYLKLKTDDDFRELERSWHAYIENELKLTGPKALAKAAAQAVSSGRPLRARRLFEEAIAAGSDSPLTFHRFADLLYDEEQYEAAVANWKHAIERDPMEAQFYYSMAKAVAKTDLPEGKRLRALAREMSPGTRFYK